MSKYRIKRRDKDELKSLKSDIKAEKTRYSMLKEEYKEVQREQKLQPSNNTRTNKTSYRANIKSEKTNNYTSNTISRSSEGSNSEKLTSRNSYSMDNNSKTKKSSREEYLKNNKRKEYLKNSTRSRVLKQKNEDSIVKKVKEQENFYLDDSSFRKENSKILDIDNNSNSTSSREYYKTKALKQRNERYSKEKFKNDRLRKDNSRKIFYANRKTNHLDKTRVSDPESNSGIKNQQVNELKEDLKEQKSALKLKKKEYRKKKKIYKRKYQSKIKRKVKEGLKGAVSQTYAIETVLSKDEDLARYVKAKNKYGAVRYEVEKYGRLGKEVVKKTSKFTYGVGNRTYNLKNGRGFTRTPKRFTWQYRLKQKILANKKYQRAKQVKNTASKVTRPFTKPVGKLVKNVYKNPLGRKGLLSLLALIVLISMFMSSVSPSRMNEWEMNDTWLYFTKLDREKSTDKVIYYSDVEDYVYYLNYRYDKTVKQIYGDPSAYKDKHLPHTRQGRTFLEGMWEFLNGDKDSLKTVDNLVNDDGEYGLDEKERKEWKQLVEISKDTGRFPFSRELDNFLFDKKDSKYKLPMKVLERYGYKDKDNISDTTTFQADPNQYIYASMTGKVSIDGNDVSIEQGRKRITYYDLQNIRVTAGEQALRNEIIGQVKQEGKQAVKYEKLKDNNGKQEWTSVNIGFYLPSIQYMQKTEVIRDLGLNGDKLERIREFVDLVKKYEPNATNEGLAAILGVFDIESGVQPKRAEGDYLPQPIGASDNSWDDENWLSISGPQIYNGRFSNIVHRGLGLGQFTDTADGSRRHTMLLDFAKEKNSKWYYMDLQVDFIFNGDSPYYREVFRNIVTSQDSVESLVARFLKDWEGGYTDKLDSRIERAKDIFRYLKSGGGTAGHFKDKSDQELWNKVASTHHTRPGSWGLQPHVSQMRAFLMEKFELGDVGGYRHKDTDGTNHGHGDGLALDLMLPIGSPRGKAITSYLIENYNDLRIYYIIYEQRFYTKDVPNIYGPANNWNLMPNRGSITENHYDHIHISFKRQGEA
ncbi:phage tail tip lysozyme [uncultured Gemella sp.]|uniref:phage tail tip lysozyme n=1 Tax=uncultured Gemella sp. TaxID=254352 RepID=UPI0028E35D61|nr:phage tail tip lysozyme [uncultured Gemella sp.]